MRALHASSSAISFCYLHIALVRQDQCSALDMFQDRLDELRTFNIHPWGQFKDAFQFRCECNYGMSVWWVVPARHIWNAKFPELFGRNNQVRLHSDERGSSARHLDIKQGVRKRNLPQESLELNAHVICLLVCLLACLPTHLLACLSACLPIHLRIDLFVYLLTYGFFTGLLACLHRRETD